MTVNNQPAAPMPDPGPAFNIKPVRGTRAAATWAGNKDAIQLSRLGGVLNVFETDASSSLNRVEYLHSQIRNQAYSVSGAVLSRKLIHEMFVKR
jgi:hypothetical protein